MPRHQTIKPSEENQGNTNKQTNKQRKSERSTATQRSTTRCQRASEATRERLQHPAASASQWNDAGSQHIYAHRSQSKTA